MENCGSFKSFGFITKPLCTMVIDTHRFSIRNKTVYNTLLTKTHRLGTWEFKNRTSTVGLPRLSKIWCALMAWIVIAIGEERFLVLRVCERGREKSRWSSRFF